MTIINNLPFFKLNKRSKTRVINSQCILCVQNIFAILRKSLNLLPLTPATTIRHTIHPYRQNSERNIPNKPKPHAFLPAGPKGLLPRPGGPDLRAALGLQVPQVAPPGQGLRRQPHQGPQGQDGLRLFPQQNPHGRHLQHADQDRGAAAAQDPAHRHARQVEIAAAASGPTAAAAAAVVGRPRERAAQRAGQPVQVRRPGVRPRDLRVRGPAVQAEHRASGGQFHGDEFEW